MRKRKYIKKQVKKLFDKVCYFCGYDKYEGLDCHRIIEGSAGGRYTEHNTIVVCTNCHRKIHAGKIKIDRKYFSTSGKWVLHYWDENGQEKWY